MSYFGVRLANPWAKNAFDNIYTFTRPISKNKFIEIELLEINAIVEANITWSHRCDHAGLTLELGLFGTTLTIALLDCRHWDNEKNRWVRYIE